MSPFFDDLEQQLRNAAHAEDPAPAPSGPRRPGPAWWRRTLRSLPVAAAVAVALAVAGGALVLAGHGHPSPQTAAQGSGNPLAGRLPAQLGPELVQIRSATALAARSRVCAVRPPGRVIYIHRTPGNALLDTLGILRRPAVASDALTTADIMDSGPVYAGYARRALRVGGTSYFIQAIRVIPSYFQPSARCFALQRRVLHEHLSRIAPRLRRATVSLQERLMAFDLRVTGAKPADAVCFVAVMGNGSSWDCADTVDAIRGGQALQSDGSTLTGVVPDGVARVRITFAGAPAPTFVAPVVGNVFVAHVSPAARSHGLSEIVWLAANGQALRIRHIAPEPAFGYCRRHIIACVAIGAAYSSSGATSSRSAGPGSGASGGSASSSSSSTRTSGG